MTPKVLGSFNPQKLEEIRQTLDTAISKPSPKTVDIRFTVASIIYRFYVVFFVFFRAHRLKPDNYCYYISAVFSG